MKENRSETKKQGKRELILAAAAKLFSEKGYEQTKIIDIAEEANIGKGTVYEYFGSKSDIAVEWVKYRFSTYRDSFVDLMNSEMSSEEKIRYIAEQDSELLHVFIGNFEIVMDVMKTMHNHPNDAFHEELKLLANEEIEMLVQIVQEGMDSGEFVEGNARAIATVLMGATGFFITFKARCVANAPGGCGFQPFGEYDTGDWDIEELYKVIFGGLRRK